MDLRPRTNTLATSPMLTGKLFADPSAISVAISGLCVHIGDQCFVLTKDMENRFSFLSRKLHEITREWCEPERD